MIEKRKGVMYFPDGREVCDKTSLVGRREYRTRTLAMLIRQENRCCLEGYAPMCPGRLAADEATMEHEFGRGMGGAKRNDATELPDGTWINGAAHALCNAWKASRYIAYNRSLQPNRRVCGEHATHTA